MGGSVLNTADHHETKELVTINDPEKNMCIQYIASVSYDCGHTVDEIESVEECEGLTNNECSGVTDEPLPSSADRTGALCPDCAARADKTTSPETEGETTAQGKQTG